MTDKDRHAVFMLVCSVCEAVKAGQEQGATGGILYLGLQTVAGINLLQFNTLMDSMVQGKLLVRSGHQYFLTPAGEKLTAVL